MPATTIDFPDLDLVKALQSHVSQADCVRLGFLVDDGPGAQTISPVGFGYLVFAQAFAGASAAETFAAGFKCATDSRDPLESPTQ